MSESEATKNKNAVSNDDVFASLQNQQQQNFHSYHQVKREPSHR